MTATTVRDRLHQQIDILPDDVVQQVADFMFFVMNRRQTGDEVYDWSEDDWRTFASEQFFREEDKVTYTLEDAKEIYHP